MTDPPNATTAPLEPIRIICAGPGPHHTFDWIPRGGRRPKYCDRHRRSKSVERSELAYRERKGLAAEIAAQGEAARHVGRVLRLAAGLRVFGDPELAARLAGVTETGAALDELVAQARKEQSTVVAGDMRGTAHLAESVAHILLVEVLERRAEIPAKDLAQFARFALAARQEFIGEGPQTNYIAISIGVVPPPADGQLTPEQRAKVQGRAQAPTDADPGW